MVAAGIDLRNPAVRSWGQLRRPPGHRTNLPSPKAHPFRAGANLDDAGGTVPAESRCRYLDSRFSKADIEDSTEEKRPLDPWNPSFRLTGFE